MPTPASAEYSLDPPSRMAPASSLHARPTSKNATQRSVWPTSTPAMVDRANRRAKGNVD
jgi:hypothetical protein